VELFKQLLEPLVDLQMGISILQNLMAQLMFVLIMKEISLLPIVTMLKFEKSQRVEMFKQLLEPIPDFKMGISMLQKFIIHLVFLLIMKEILLFLILGIIRFEKSQVRK